MRRDVAPGLRASAPASRPSSFLPSPPPRSSASMAAAIMAAEQEAAKGGGRNRGGVQRVEGKLRASVEKGDYYEAHQMYRTLFFRYGSARRPPAPPPRGLPEPSHASLPAAARRAHVPFLLAAAPVRLRLSLSHWAARGRGGAGVRMAGCGRHGSWARPARRGVPPRFLRASPPPVVTPRCSGVPPLAGLRRRAVPVSLVRRRDPRWRREGRGTRRC